MISATFCLPRQKPTVMALDKFHRRNKMAFTLQQLHDEIENDPMEIDYKEPSGEWKGDQVIADLINDPVNGGVIQRSQLLPQEIIEQIVKADWDAISDASRQYISLLPSLQVISAVQDGTEVRVNLLAIFGVVRRRGTT